MFSIPAFELPSLDGQQTHCRVDIEVTSLGTNPTHDHPGDPAEWRVTAFEVWVPETGAWLTLWLAGDDDGAPFPAMDETRLWGKAIADEVADQVPNERARSRLSNRSST